MPKNAPKELDIKAKILTRLRKELVIDKHTILSSEFSVSSSNLRADLAILSSEFIGIEIKSEFDTLRRLPNQLIGYRSLFDRVILVVAGKHLAALNSMDLAGVETWLIGSDGVLEPATSTLKQKQATERVNLTSLLTKREIAKLKLGPSHVSPYEEKSAFFCAFSARFSKTSAAFWKAVARRDVRAQDLALLSRFREQRSLFQQSAKARDKYHLMLAEQWKNISSNFQSDHSSSVSIAPTASP
jgi:hypothetical protein